LSIVSDGEPRASVKQISLKDVQFADKCGRFGRFSPLRTIYSVI
jgi:hypothetical protein